MDHSLQALSLWRDQADAAGEAHTLYDLGSMFRGIERGGNAIDYFKKAQDYLDQCIQLARKQGDSRHEAEPLYALSLLYLSLGEAERARDCSQ